MLASIRVRARVEVYAYFMTYFDCPIYYLLRISVHKVQPSVTWSARSVTGYTYIHTWIITPEGSKTYNKAEKHTIKHKEEHNIQKDKKYTKLNYKNTIH